MPYQPVHQKQLRRGVPVPGRTRGSRDCGPRSWQMIADARTRGRVRPGVYRLRRRAGVSGPQATSIDDGQRALNGLPVPGRKPLKAWRKRKLRDLNAAVRAGRPAMVAIHYGHWNRTQDKRTGDPNFTGAHAVAILDERRRGAGIEWLLGDPLDDGRRKGIERGARWVKRKDVNDAALALAGGNRNGIWALVVGGAGER